MEHCLRVAVLPVSACSKDAARDSLPTTVWLFKRMTNDGIAKRRLVDVRDAPQGVLESGAQLWETSRHFLSEFNAAHLLDEDVIAMHLHVVVKGGDYRDNRTVSVFVVVFVDDDVRCVCDMHSEISPCASRVPEGLSTSLCGYREYDWRRRTSVCGNFRRRCIISQQLLQAFQTELVGKACCHIAPRHSANQRRKQCCFGVRGGRCRPTSQTADPSLQGGSRQHRREFTNDLMAEHLRAEVKRVTNLKRGYNRHRASAFPLEGPTRPC